MSPCCYFREEHRDIEKPIAPFLEQEPGNKHNLLLLRKKTKAHKQTKHPHPTEEAQLDVNI